MKRFLTLFPKAANLHLTKEVGLIPYVLHRHYGYYSTLASYKNGDYPDLSGLVSGLKQTFIKRIFGHELFDVLNFLLFNSRKYDVLNVYHLVHASWISALFFKVVTLNRGKVFLKLDADYRLLTYQPKGLKKTISDFIFSKIDLISVESEAYAAYLNGNHVFPRPVSLLPSGYYEFHQHRDVSFCEKEDLMITVGRIGAKQKATEILCEGFAIFSRDFPTWQLKIIGPIDSEFVFYMSQFYKKYPELAERVSFLGSVTDREILNSWYRRAKVFLLTSRWEGFPNVYPEAILHGCYIVSSALPAAYDITAQGKYGSIVPIDDTEKLSSTLKVLAAEPAILASNCKEAQAFALENFSWINICGQINQLLK